MDQSCLKYATVINSLAITLCAFLATLSRFPQSHNSRNLFLVNYSNEFKPGIKVELDSVSVRNISGYCNHLLCSNGHRCNQDDDVSCDDDQSHDIGMSI